MELTWPRPRTTLNSGLLFFSFALVGISPAVLYLTIHGMKFMDHAWSQGSYLWYRGPSYDPDTKHMVNLIYDDSNENMIIAAGVVSALAGVIGIVGFFLAGNPLKPTAQKFTLFLQIVPGTVAFIVTFVAFVYTQTLFDTDNRRKCDWTSGYIPDINLECTREQAACTIVGFFARESWDLARSYYNRQRICHDTETGRHLVAPLFVASILMCGLAVGKFFVEKRESRFIETPDERADRLQRQE